MQRVAIPWLSRFQLLHSSAKLSREATHESDHGFPSFVLNGFHTTGAVFADAPAFISHRQERVS